MAKLIYAAIASLDGYVEDEEGRFCRRVIARIGVKPPLPV